MEMDPARSLHSSTLLLGIVFFIMCLLGHKITGEIKVLCVDCVLSYRITLIRCALLFLILSFPRSRCAHERASNTKFMILYIVL